jgi:hypothetical protein
MGQMRRVATGLALAAAAMLLVVLVTATAASAATHPWTSACHDCSGSYSGTYAANETLDDPNGGTDTLTVHYSWDEAIRYLGNGESASGPVTIQGAYSLTATGGSAAEYQPCSGTIHETYSQGGDEVFAFQEHGPDHYELSGDEATASTNGCGPTPYVGGVFSGPKCHWTVAPDSAFSIAESGSASLNVTVPAGSYDQSDTCELDTDDAPYHSESQTITDHLSWHGLSASGTGIHSSPPPVYGPFFRRAKRLARVDLLRTIRQWGPACTQFAIAGTLAGAGVLVSGLPGTAALTISITGGLTTEALSPFCGAAITRAILDLHTYNDPPLRSFTVLAHPRPARPPRLSACRPRDKAYCSKLRSAWGRYDLAVLDGNADVTAIEQTVSREHAAAVAHRRSDVDRQDGDLRTLLVDLDAANSRETSAARAVDKLFAGAHLRLQLSAVQDGTLTTKLIAALAKQHVSKAEILMLDSSAFTPRAVNLLNGLA